MNRRLFVLSVLAFATTQSQGAEPRVANIEMGRDKWAATVERDCAPWDGAAFGLWIPAENFGGKPDSWIYLRIWHQPEKSRTTFFFPDKTGKNGRVIYYLDLKSPQSIVWQKQPRQELNGQVHFIRVNEKESVLGEFDFLSEGNIHLKGNFEAQWINKIVLCG